MPSLVHHLEFGLGAISLGHSTRHMLPCWHTTCIGLQVSALLLGLANRLLHKGCLPGLVLGVVHTLLTLNPGKVVFGLGRLSMWVAG